MGGEGGIGGQDRGELGGEGYYVGCDLEREYGLLHMYRIKLCTTLCFYAKMFVPGGLLTAVKGLEISILCG